MTVVFTDAFTVGADANIDAYPATPDYAYNNGSGADLTVQAANDRVQATNAAVTGYARIIDASVPTTDCQITADCFSSTGYTSGGVAVRLATAGTANGYFTYFEDDQANECRLFRVDSGTETLIDSVNAGFLGGSMRSHRLKVEGAGATVTLTWQIGTMTERVFGDTNANRKTSGAPGIIGYSDTGTDAWVDNVSVDDLAAAGGTFQRIVGNRFALAGPGGLAS